MSDIVFDGLGIFMLPVARAFELASLLGSATGNALRPNPPSAL